MHRLRRFTRVHFGRDAVTEETVNRLVVPVETVSVVIGLGAEAVDRDGNLGIGVPATFQKRRQLRFLDVAVPVPMCPASKETVSQFVSEQRDHPLLRGALGLAELRV